MRKRTVSTGSPILAGLSVLTFLGTAMAQVPPESESFMAHFVSVRLPNATRQSTIVILSNTGDEDRQATVDFISSDGTPALLVIFGEGEQPVSRVVRTVKAGGSTQIVTSARDELQSGWIRVAAASDVRATGIVQFIGFLGDFRRVEASILAAGPTSKAIVPVERESPGFLPLPDLSTAIALANPFEEDALVTLVLLNNEGTEIERQDLLLESLTQTARFIEDLFPNMPLVDPGIDAPKFFHGSLQVISERPVVLSVLRTQGGLQLSSPPIAQKPLVF